MARINFVSVLFAAVTVIFATAPPATLQPAFAQVSNGELNPSDVTEEVILTLQLQ